MGERLSPNEGRIRKMASQDGEHGEVVVGRSGLANDKQVFRVR